MKKLLPVLIFGAGAAMLLAGGKKSRKQASGPEKIPEKTPEAQVRDPRVYVFEAEWCEYCKKAKPALLEVAKHHPDIPFEFVDFDAEKKLVETYEIKSLPTVIATVNGQVVNRIEGAGSVEQYGEMAEEVSRMASGAIPLPASEGPKKLPSGD